MVPGQWHTRCVPACMRGGLMLCHGLGICCTCCLGSGTHHVPCCHTLCASMHGGLMLCHGLGHLLHCAPAGAMVLHQWPVSAPRVLRNPYFEKTHAQSSKLPAQPHDHNSNHNFRSTSKQTTPKNSNSSIFYDFPKFYYSKNHKNYFTIHFPCWFVLPDSLYFSLPSCKISHHLDIVWVS